MKLVIVESPTKAKSIGQFLGSEYEVIASKGHIRDIRKDPFGVDIDNAFKTEWVYIKEKNDDSEKIVQEIKERASKASEVIIATDPDRKEEAKPF